MMEVSSTASPASSVPAMAADGHEADVTCVGDASEGSQPLIPTESPAVGVTTTTEQVSQKKRPADTSGCNDDGAADAAAAAAAEVPVGLEYTTRDDHFTSEIYKLCIRNLGGFRHAHVGQQQHKKKI